MVYKESPIDRLGIGNLILELNRAEGLSVRKIVSRLQEEGHLWRKKPISKSAIHRWLQDHKRDSETSAIASGGLDIEQETVEMFKSCKKIFKLQLDAVNQTLHSKDGGELDTKALYALLGTAKTLLSQLDLYLKRLSMGASEGAIQKYINEYNNKTANVIQYVIKLEIKDETTRARLLDKLAETFDNPPEEVFGEDTGSS